MRVTTKEGSIHMNLKHSMWFVAAALLGSISPAQAQDLKSVSVVAEADYSGDMSITERDLKRQARRKAIEEGVGLAVSSNSIVRNFELVADEITTEAKGIISEEKWGPITDGPTGSTKKITLSAKVSKNVTDLEKAACTVIKANHNPKVSLVFVEKIGNAEKWITERGLVEAMFSEAFINSCFTLVESGVKVTEVSATGDLPQDTINDIIKNSDAQYVVLGQGKIMKSDAKSLLGDNMNSYSISASLKLINTANNAIEAVATKQVQVLGISPEVALNIQQNKKGQLVNGIMDELIEKVTTRWNGEINSSTVQVIVDNVPNYAAAKAFRELCEKVLKAKVEQRSVAKGKASFDVDVEGGSDSLAAGIEGKKAGKYTVEVIEVSRGKVILKLN
jgi:hypothetical protein